MMREGKKDEAVGFGTKVLRKEKRKRDNMGVSARERERLENNTFILKGHMLYRMPPFRGTTPTLFSYYIAE